MGKKCSSCHKPNHFAVVCKSTSRPRSNTRQVRLIDQESSEEKEDDDYITVVDERASVDAVTYSAHPNKVFAALVVNNTKERFQLDSGATVNVMSDYTLSKLCADFHQLENCNTTLVMYNLSEVKSIGKKKLRILNPTSQY